MSVLDVDAVRAVTRLIDKGFEAYLVGGCVRDLLLDRDPKDYDIATEARPPQVKRTFPRNCRIIGRRFKLAHLHFHGNTKILECSTFRRTPQEQKEGDGDDPDLLITRDNEFGTAEEDALRRDFTINALFLDPTEDKIVDHVNGLADIEARVIRTIGDPVVRFREDPVRILRAAKFAGRLGFEVEKDTLAAMAETAEDLVRAAPPRVLEEILRLLRSGHALPSFQLLREVGAVRYLVPVVGSFLADADDEHAASFWALLESLDDLIKDNPGNEPPPNGVLLAALMYHAVAAESENQPNRSVSSVAEELLGSLAIDLRLPRRDSGCLKRICGVQHRFSQPEEKRRFRIDSFVRSPYFHEALQLFELRAAAADLDMDQVEHWRTLAGTPESDEDADLELLEEEAPRKKRRRRRRRKSGQADADAPEATEDGESTAEAGDEPAAEVDATPDEEDAPKPKARKLRSRRTRKATKTEDRDDQPEASSSEHDLSDVMFPDAEEAPPALDEAAPEGEEEGQARKPAKKKSKKRKRRKAAADDDVTFPVEDDDANRAVDEHVGDEHAGDEEEHADAAAGFDDEPSEESDAGDDAEDRSEDEEREPSSRRRRRGRRGRGRGKKRTGEADDEAAEQPLGDGEDVADEEGQEAKARKSRSRKPKDQKKDPKDKRRGGDKKKKSRRDGKRPGKTKKGGGSDVDVVPRYRDRRGKVEVIEPVSLDLSAFDVELDPKRVPTFGSIVEGKSRPKRRGPRVRDKDDYRPPPPPGGGGGPEAPPPPPPADDSDTFGDW